MTTPTAKVTKIIVQIGDTEVPMTIEQARALCQALEQLVGSKEEVHHHHHTHIETTPRPFTWPRTPVYPDPAPVAPIWSYARAGATVTLAMVTE
jgi:hypothetical protein